MKQLKSFNFMQEMCMHIQAHGKQQGSGLDALKHIKVPTMWCSANELNYKLTLKI